ncbi:MAG: hypothetical protein H0T52_01675, partial [Lautropia sp.]|nr:hypothetical protein [Lautropia sp.]
GEGSAKTLEGGVLASATLMRHMARNMARNVEIKATIDSVGTLMDALPPDCADCALL